MRERVLSFVLLCASCKHGPSDCYDTSVSIDGPLVTVALSGCGDGKKRGVTCTPDGPDALCTCSVEGATQSTFTLRGGVPSDGYTAASLGRHCNF